MASGSTVQEREPPHEPFRSRARFAAALWGSGPCIFARRVASIPLGPLPGWVLSVGTRRLIAGLTTASFVTGRYRWHQDGDDAQQAAVAPVALARSPGAHDPAGVCSSRRAGAGGAAGGRISRARTPALTVRRSGRRRRRGRGRPAHGSVADSGVSALSPHAHLL